MWKFIIFLAIFTFFFDVYSQGSVNFSVIGPDRTRVGSADGPFAGETYLGQLLAGKTEESLSPVGVPLPHIQSGKTPIGAIVAGTVIIDGILHGEAAVFQFVAWDQTAWGDNVLNVPDSFLGKTQKVEITLGAPGVGVPPPVLSFPSGAIVPLIPEPNSRVFLLFGGIFTLISIFKK